MSLFFQSNFAPSLVASTGGWAAVQQWASAVSGFRTAQEVPGFVSTTLYLSTQLREAGGYDEAADLLRQASPPEILPLVAPLDGTRAATTLEERLPDRWRDRLRVQAQSLQAILQGRTAQPVAPAASGEEDLDDLHACRAAIEEGTPRLLQVATYLYVQASEQSLVSLQPIFRARLQELRDGLDDLQRYARRMTETSLRPLGFRREAFLLALGHLEQLVHPIGKIQSKGLSPDLSSKIRRLLVKAGRALDPPLGVYLEADLPVLVGAPLHPPTATLSQLQGALLAAAGGDAWASAYESMTAAEMTQRKLRIDRFEPKGDRPPGYWTDDTTLAQATLIAILEKRAVVPRLIAYRFAQLVPQIRTRGFGQAGKRALVRLQRHHHWTESGDPESLGSGAAMWVLPVALFSYRNLEALRKNVMMASQITHHQYEAVAGAMAIAFVVAKILRNEFNPRSILTETRLFIGPGRVSEQLAVADRLLRAGGPPMEAMKSLGTGPVVWEAVAAALYAFLSSTNDFESSLLLVARSGGDTDTIASMTGALSGAYNGVQAIPANWRTEVEDGELILERAHQLYGIIHPDQET